jgi:hypothetical protein
MSQIKGLIMATSQQIITNLPIGKANAIKVLDLETAVGSQTVGANNDVQKAIFNDEIPIGSCRNGYYLIDSDAEYQEIIDKIDTQIKAYEEKKIALAKGWQRRKLSIQSGIPWPK